MSDVELFHSSPHKLAYLHLLPTDSHLRLVLALDLVPADLLRHNYPLAATYCGIAEGAAFGDAFQGLPDPIHFPLVDLNCGHHADVLSLTQPAV